MSLPEVDLLDGGGGVGEELAGAPLALADDGRGADGGGDREGHDDGDRREEVDGEGVGGLGLGRCRPGARPGPAPGGPPASSRAARRSATSATLGDDQQQDRRQDEEEERAEADHRAPEVAGEEELAEVGAGDGADAAPVHVSTPSANGSEKRRPIRLPELTRSRSSGVVSRGTTPPRHGTGPGRRSRGPRGRARRARRGVTRTPAAASAEDELGHPGVVVDRDAERAVAVGGSTASTPVGAVDGGGDRRRGRARRGGPRRAGQYRRVSSCGEPLTRSRAAVEDHDLVGEALGLERAGACTSRPSRRASVIVADQVEHGVRTTRGRDPRSARRRGGGRARGAPSGRGPGGSSCRSSTRRPAGRGRARSRSGRRPPRCAASAPAPPAEAVELGGVAEVVEAGQAGRRGPAWPTRRRSGDGPPRRRVDGSRPKVRTSPASGTEGAGDHADGGGLAGAVRAQQHGDASRRHREGEPGERGVAAEGAVDAVEGDDGSPMGGSGAGPVGGGGGGVGIEARVDHGHLGDRRAGPGSGAASASSGGASVAVRTRVRARPRALGARVMRVLGIDPGLSRCGYGCLDAGAAGAAGASARPVAVGVLRTPVDAPFPSAWPSSSGSCGH